MTPLLTCVLVAAIVACAVGLVREERRQQRDARVERILRATRFRTEDDGWTDAINLAYWATRLDAEWEAAGADPDERARMRRSLGHHPSVDRGQP